MKSKHRNFWSFFWRVGAGFLAFYLAVMGLFTYFVACGKLNAARTSGGSREELRLEAVREIQRAALPGNWYYICNAVADSVAMVGVFDENGSLVASSGNYINTLSFYMDVGRWLTEEEQYRLVELAQESMHPIETGSIIYILHINGWQDGELLIPHQITYSVRTYEMLEDGGISYHDSEEETLLMKRQPDIDTSELWYLPFTMEVPFFSAAGSFALPGFDLKDGVSGYVKVRDTGEWKQMYDRMLTLADGLKNKDFVVGGLGEDNSIFHYYIEYGWYLGDDYFDTPQEGKYLIYLWSYYPLREAMEELTPAYGIAMLTMLVMSAVLAYALLRVWRKQERVEQARRDTTAALAHELKTPLSVLSATAELLSNDMAKDKRAHYLDVIQQQAQRMDGSVRRMLELSRLEAGAKALRREQVSLSALVRERLDAAVPPDSQMHTSVVVDGAEEAEADRALLARALDAILENAVQRTPPDGSITVRIENGVCAVVNAGEPIPSTALPRLWEPYYQADPARTGKGDGLGLSIAKTVFDLHGYAYGAENTPAGPRFWFRFDKA